MSKVKEEILLDFENSQMYLRSCRKALKNVIERFPNGRIVDIANELLEQANELYKMIRDIYEKEETDKMMIRCIIDDVDVLRKEVMNNGFDVLASRK